MRLRRGLALAAALLVAAGCGGGDLEDERRRAAPSPLEQLAGLLEKRAEALDRRDARALAGTTVPGRLRRADRRRLRHLRGLPIQGLRYAVDDVEVSARRATVRAFETYRVAGVPGSIFGVRRTFRARRDGDGWRLVEQRPGRERQPWEVTRLRAVRRGHAVVLAPAGIDVVAAGLPAAVGAARRTVDRALPGRPSRRYLVLVAGSARQARRLATRIAGIESLVAIADSDVRQPRGATRPVEVVAQRLVLVWPRYRELGAAGRARILEHEITHLATAAATSAATPSWLVEGLALHVSGDRRVEEAARLVDAVVLGGAGGRAAREAHRSLALTALSAPDAIARLDGEGQGAAYAYSSAAAFYIADRYGRRRLLSLYRAFTDPDLPGEPGPDATDAAVRRVLGLSLARLERNLRAWILARALVAPEAP